MNFMVNESAQKLRGGYYTPLDLAAYITRWTLEKNPRTLLEPSCGMAFSFRLFLKLAFRKTCHSPDLRFWKQKRPRRGFAARINLD